MKIRYLDTSDPGMHWMRSYYRKNPQLNRAKALASLRRAEQTLANHEGAGHKFQDMDGVWECQISGTQFSLLYTVARDTLWIIDIRDQRGFRSAEALRMYARELRHKYGIK